MLFSFLFVIYKNLNKKSYALNFINLYNIDLLNNNGNDV